MLFVIAILIVLYLLWVLFHPTWLPKPPANKVNDAITTNANQLYTTSESWVKRATRWLPGQNKDLAQKFKAWVAATNVNDYKTLYQNWPSDAAACKAWVAGLSDKDLQAYVGQVDAFCNARGIDLEALVGVKTDPETRRALEEMVILHSLTLWQARDVHALLAYEAWKDNPRAAQHRAFAQKLFAKAVAAGLATAPSDLMLAPDKERQEYVAKALDKVATENHAAFLQLVKAALFEPTPAATAQPAAAPAAA